MDGEALGGGWGWCCKGGGGTTAGNGGGPVSELSMLELELSLGFGW